MVVALLVLPARAHEGMAEAAGRAVVKMGDLAAIVLKGDPNAIQSLHDDIRIALTQAEAAGDDAVRERATYLSAGPDPQSILRTLRRLRNDLAAIGRTAVQPASQSASNVVSAIAAILHAIGNALANHEVPPSLDGVDSAFAQYAATVAETRRQGLTREMSDETVSRLFGQAFALEQLHQNLKDLADRTTELSQIRR
jgi:hypothetical protein